MRYYYSLDILLQVLVRDRVMVSPRGAVKVEMGRSSSNRQTKTYQCPHCDRTTHKINAMTHHIRSHTGEKPFFCPYCPFRSAQKANLNTHIRIHTGERPFACNHCPFRAVQKIHLKNHIAKHHSQTPYIKHLSQKP
ncbi:hypothetical protein Pmani_026306 [Petrolisthes manimaculis]|uniref:C2H2-type domain-containing protein n=1 Tax=Petrolisthes manimaculis TaxID=1843537 RepID=A0AAE1P4B2_9EUCA|nr:hypothetical protein Pmani_026306 [Petrolisthes manimaculis]